jgi:hypothetical protein
LRIGGHCAAWELGLSSSKEQRKTWEDSININWLNIQMNWTQSIFLQRADLPFAVMLRSVPIAFQPKVLAGLGCIAWIDVMETDLIVTSSVLIEWLCSRHESRKRGCRFRAWISESRLSRTILLPSFCNWISKDISMDTAWHDEGSQASALSSESRGFLGNYVINVAVPSSQLEMLIPQCSDDFWQALRAAVGSGSHFLFSLQTMPHSQANQCSGHNLSAPWLNWPELLLSVSISVCPWAWTWWHLMIWKADPWERGLSLRPEPAEHADCHSNHTVPLETVWRAYQTQCGSWEGEKQTPALL